MDVRISNEAYLAITAHLSLPEPTSNGRLFFRPYLIFVYSVTQSRCERCSAAAVAANEPTSANWERCQWINSVSSSCVLEAWCRRIFAATADRTKPVGRSQKSPAVDARGP